MKVLVLGGNGFIGSHVVDALLAAGHEVNVFDRMHELWRSPLPGVQYFLGDFSDSSLLAESMQNVDVVVHLISATVPGTSNMDPVADIHHNLEKTVRLLQLMTALNMRRLVFLSSGGTVYGLPSVIPVPETHDLAPICSYGVVKLAIEKYIGAFSHLYGIEPVIIRPANPFGPRQGHQNVQGVIATFMRKMLKREKIQIWGDGSVRRDYIYVTDLARLCLRAIEEGHCGIFNAGSGYGVSLNDIIAMIQAETGIKAEVEYTASRKFDVHEICLDIGKANKVYGWQPEIPLVQGMAMHHAWLSEAAGL